MKENQTEHYFDRERRNLRQADIIVSQETYRKNILGHWVIDPHYVAEVKIDGKMYCVDGNFETRADAHCSAQEHLEVLNRRLDRMERERAYWRGRIAQLAQEGGAR